jgi:hypothetical protein
MYGRLRRPPMPSLWDALRRPEHTGDRRCWPCTLVNAVLVAAGALLLARRHGRTTGAFAAAAGGALIALRGYVVPGTPTVAPALVRALGVEHPFHDDPAGVRTRPAGPGGVDVPLAGDDGRDRGVSGGHADPNRTGGTDGGVRNDAAPEAGATDAGPDGSDGGSRPEPDSLAAGDGKAVLAGLVEAGVLDAEGDRVALSPAVEEAWQAEMDRLGEMDTPALATAVAEVTGVSARAETIGRRAYVVVDGGDEDGRERLLPRPVAVAEAAAVGALADRVEDPELRRVAAGALRSFLDACPDCGAAPVETERTSCCGGAETAEAPEEVLACPDCDVALFTFAPEETV